MKKVRNIASPINTWLGGDCCVPSDVRTKPRTMTIRVKLVISINIAGAILRTVNINTIEIALVPEPSVSLPIEMFTFGIGSAYACDWNNPNMTN